MLHVGLKVKWLKFLNVISSHCVEGKPKKVNEVYTFKTMMPFNLPQG